MFRNFNLSAAAILSFTVGYAQAQSIQQEGSNPGSSKKIELTCNKTSSLVFAAVVKTVDRGSPEILAQKVKGVENVLHLKAAHPEFSETNLTVITADGQIHEFTLTYAQEPSQQVWTPTQWTTAPYTPIIFPAELSESDLADYSARILAHKTRKGKARGKSNRITLTLRGVYVKDKVLFCRFEIDNRSHIQYDIDYLRFFIRDKNNVKRTASQEVTLQPLYTYGQENVVHGNTSHHMVYSLDKFTIPDAKRLVVEMFEKKGGRNINLSIRNRTIVNAALIP